MQKETLDLLVKWRASLDGSACIDRLYVFGSLINDQGRDFHKKNSDIDLVITFGSAADPISARLASLHYLEQRLEELELGLIKLLHRDAQHPHTSLVCLTEVERYHGIHKAMDFNLLSERQFLEINDGASFEADHVYVTDALDEPEFRTECGDAINVVAYAQEIRNKFLSNSLNTSFRGLSDFNDEDPLPKKAMRVAAMLGWRALGEDARKRTDLAVGLRYLQNLIAERSADFKDLHRKLEGRILKRGTPQPLSRADQLVIAEVLFEAARPHLISRRSRLDGIIGRI